jgi:hypothetical protein
MSRDQFEPEGAVAAEFAPMGWRAVMVQVGPVMNRVLGENCQDLGGLTVEGR